MTGSGIEKDRRFATTLARGLSVLRAFRTSDDGLGNAEIAQRTGLPKSTVSRLTFTLQSLGYLTHGHRHDRYRLGPALMALGNLASASMSFVDLAAPVMQRLADQTRTLSLLAVRDENKVMLLKTWRPVGVASLWLEVGHRIPFDGSASGHALMAAYSDERYATLIQQLQTDTGITTERADAIRTSAASQLLVDGFVEIDSAEYFSPNINAVSVPFHTRDLLEPVVFSCGAVPSDLTHSRIQSDVGPALKSAVAEVDRIMGQGPALVRV